MIPAEVLLMKRTKKLLSFLIVIAMTVTLFPAVSLLGEEASAAVFSDYAQMYATESDHSSFRVGFTFRVNNVKTGTKGINWTENNGGCTQVGVSSPVFLKTFQAPGNKGVDASKATVEIDRSLYSDINSLGVQIQLNPQIHTQKGVRWGIELFPYSTGYTTGSLGNSWNTTTVTGSTGARYTYTLCNASGATMASAETAGGDFTQNAGTTTGADLNFGPYYWYLKGAAPKVGETCVLRIVAICGCFCG